MLTISNRPFVRERRFGFTLIELLIVITIVGLLASITIVRTSVVARKARLRQAIDRFTMSDGLLRSHASKHSIGGELKIEVGTPNVQSKYGSSSDHSNVDLGNVSILRIKTVRRELTNATYTIKYSPKGTSETYAVAFKGLEAKPVWIVFSGETGQSKRFEEERDVEQLFKSLAY